MCVLGGDLEVGYVICGFEYSSEDSGPTSLPSSGGPMASQGRKSALYPRWTLDHSAKPLLHQLALHYHFALLTRDGKNLKPTY